MGRGRFKEEDTESSEVWGSYSIGVAEEIDNINIEGERWTNGLLGIFSEKILL